MDFTKLSFLSCEYFQTTIPYTAPEHYHPYFELVYYISGTGKGYIDEKEYNYQAGNFVFIKPFSKHSEISIEESTLLIMAFKCPNLTLDFSNELLSDNNDNSILKELMSIYDEYKNEKTLFIEKISLLLGEAIIDIYRKQEKDIKVEKSDIIVIKNYLDDNFLENIDYKYLASKVFYSYDYLRHYFKKETGMSIKKYIINKKIEHSKNLIFNGYSVKEIAKMCKFSSPSHFISSFKEITNMTPLEFKSLSIK